MGFPSLTAALDEAESSKPTEVGSQTLFGFPAHKPDDAPQPDAPDTEPPQPEQNYDFEEDEGDATSILPASAFEFEQFAADPDEPPAAVAGSTSDHELRGTVAGMVAPGHAAPSPSTDVSGTAVFPGMRIAADDEEDLQLSNQGTLMGMTLAELTAQAPPPPTGDARSTQFAIPAVQAEKPEAPKPVPSLPSASTTQAWRPGMLDDSRLDDSRLDDSRLDDSRLGAGATQTGKPEEQEADSDARTRLMKKLRKSRPELPPLPAPPSVAAPASTPREGSVLDRLRANRPSEETAAAPSANILRPAKRPTPTPSEDAQSLEDLSDPEFGLMATDIVSADVLKQAFGAFPTPQEPDAPQQPAAAEPQAATEAQAASADPSDSTSGPIEAAPSGWSNTPEQFRPTRQPTPTQDFPPVDSHPNYNPYQPQQAQPQQYQQFQQQPQQAQQPFQQQQAAAAVGTAEQRATPAAAPNAPLTRPSTASTTAPTVTEEDNTIAKIQSVLALGSGGVAVFAVVASLLSGFPGLLRALLLLFGGAIGLVMVLAARLPLPPQIRTIAMFAVSIVMIVCCGVGLLFGLSKWFGFLALAGMIGLVAAAFPLVAKLAG